MFSFGIKQAVINALILLVAIIIVSLIQMDLASRDK